MDVFMQFCAYILHLPCRIIEDLTVYWTYFPVPVTYAFDKDNTPRGTIRVQLTLKPVRNASVMLLAAVSTTLISGKQTVCVYF
jgi:hypothetical protein